MNMMMMMCVSLIGGYMGKKEDESVHVGVYVCVCVHASVHAKAFFNYSIFFLLLSI